MKKRIILDTAIWLFLCVALVLCPFDNVKTKETEQISSCTPKNSSCVFDGLSDVITYSGISFNVSVRAASNCCCNGSDPTCDVVLKMEGDPKHTIYDSCDDDSWNCSIDIENVTDDVSFCVKVIINDEDYFVSETYNVTVQGLPGPVTNISSYITCNYTHISWVGPNTSLPVTGYNVTVNGMTNFTNETHICYSQDVIPPNTNTTISISAINELGAGDTMGTCVLSSMMPTMELASMSAPVFENSTSVTVTVAASSTAGNCSYSLPYNLLAMFTTSNNYTHSFNVSLEQQFDKNDSVQLTFSLDMGESYDAKFIWSNLVGNCTNETYFSTYLFNSTEVTALENGSIFFSFQFFVLNVPVSWFCLHIQNINNGEVETTNLTIDSIVDVISDTTIVMCEGNYSANYFVLIEDRIFSDSINKTLIVIDTIPCSSSTVHHPTSTYQPTSTVSSTVTPMPAPFKCDTLCIVLIAAVGGAVLLIVIVMVGVCAACLYKWKKRRGSHTIDNPTNWSEPSSHAQEGTTAVVATSSLESSVKVLRSSEENPRNLTVPPLWKQKTPKEPKKSRKTPPRARANNYTPSVAETEDPQNSSELQEFSSKPTEYTTVQAGTDNSEIGNEPDFNYQSGQQQCETSQLETVTQDSLMAVVKIDS